MREEVGGRGRGEGGGGVKRIARRIIIGADQSRAKVAVDRQAVTGAAP